MDNQLLTGKLIRLVGAGPDEMGKLTQEWTKDSEFFLFFDSDPVLPRNAAKAAEFFREHVLRDRPGAFPFAVEKIDDGKIIGQCGLWGANSPHRDAWISIGIGARDLWGKGYGSDAMQVLMRFGFQELNLHRINLYTFEYNPRAIRAYEKLGFVHEGKQRSAMKRGGQRWAFVFMGVLRDEWENRNRV